MKLGLGWLTAAHLTLGNCDNRDHSRLDLETWNMWPTCPRAGVDPSHHPNAQHHLCSHHSHLKTKAD